MTEIGCKKLKHLDVSESKSLTKTGNFNGLQNLEKLNLSDCENLEELDSSIGCLHQLTKIFLSHCTNLKSIPDLPPSIKVLAANGCRNLLNLPSNCSQLQFLTELQLDYCPKLGSEGFTQVTRLRNLQKLYMRNCNISQVSSGIGNLVSLKYLNLSENTFSSLPESFSNLSKLKLLYINGCSQLQLLPPLPSQLTEIRATKCGSLDVMPFDLRQKAYTFRSKVFKELLTSTEGLHIGLSGEESPEWCTYRNSGNVLSFVAPLHFHHNKICGLIFCATTNYGTFSTIGVHNKTKEKSHRMKTRDYAECTLMVVFYPLNDKTVVVEAGDTVELRFDVDYVDDDMSCGLRLIYEEDVVDSGLVLKFGAETTLPLPSVMSVTQSSDNGDCFFPIPDDDTPTPFGYHENEMTSNSITYYDFFPMVS